MRSLTTLLLLCLLVSQTGCSTKTIHADAAVAWTKSKRDLGRLALTHGLVSVGVEKSRDAKSAEVEAAIAEAFGDLPGTELVELEQATAALGDAADRKAMSEFELVEAARAENLDTVGWLIVDEYAGSVGIGFLPLPGWIVDVVVDYQLRLLDVETGELLTDTRRRRTKSSCFALGGRRDMSRMFAADLSDLLAEH